MEKRTTEGVDYAIGIDPQDIGEGLPDYGLMLPEYENPRELVSRGGVNHFRDKLRSRQEVTIAYIGGSITLQEGWRPRTTAWLRERFPQNRIHEVNAAVNGTSAEFGAMRIDEHVLVHRPDLVFVEFVINGGTVKGIEGIVRKIRRQDPCTDICFVYTINSEQVPSYRPDAEPRFPGSLQAFEAVAHHYGIPSINFGYVIGDWYARRKLVPRGIAAIDNNGIVAFTKDGTHPLTPGDQLYAGAATRSLERMLRSRQPAVPYKRKEPLDPGHWEAATMRDVAQFNDGLEVLHPNAKDFYSVFPYTGGNLTIIKSIFPTLVKLGKPGDSLTVQFHGNTIGLADVGGPFSGQLDVEVDGERLATVNRFTPYNSNLRHQVVFLPELPDGEHTVRFILSAESADKRSILNNPDHYDRDPEAYRKNEVYLGKILIVGHFVANGLRQFEFGYRQNAFHP